MPSARSPAHVCVRRRERKRRGENGRAIPRDGRAHAPEIPPKPSRGDLAEAHGVRHSSSATSCLTRARETQRREGEGEGGGGGDGRERERGGRGRGGEATATSPRIGGAGGRARGAEEEGRIECSRGTLPRALCTSRRKPPTVQAGEAPPPP